jgi:hypothetical protein
VSPLTNKRCHKSISAESKLYLLDDCGRPVDSKEIGISQHPNLTYKCLLIGLLHIPCIRPFEVAHNYENSPSLHEARKNVQSTAGLLAQLSDDIVPNSENGCTESQFLKFTSQNQTVAKISCLH